MEFTSILLTRELYDREVANKEIAVSYEEYLQIWTLITDKVKQQVCTNPLGVNLPFFLGELKVSYLPYKVPSVNNNLSQKVGMEITDTNIHSKGKRGSIVWERKQARRFNNILNIYAFEPTQKTLRDPVREALRENPELFRVGKLKMANKIRS